MKYRNLSDLFWKREAKYHTKVFLRYKHRDSQPLLSKTWAEAAKEIIEITHGLNALGLKIGDHVALLAATCHEWLLCDMGIISIGACTVPIYPSSQTEAVKYILEHAEIEMAFVRNKIQLEKIRSVWHQLPKLRYVIVIQDRGDIPNNDPRILTLDDLKRLGANNIKKDPELITRVCKEVAPDDKASIIYTSGTTGDPKGAVLTHRNFLTAALSFYQYVPLDESEHFLSFLPLAHVFERVAGQFYAIDQGAIITYCEQAEQLAPLLLESDCSVMMVVPRMLEKIHAKIMGKLKRSSQFQQNVFYQALSVSLEYVKKKTLGLKISTALEIKHKIAQKLVLSKIKNQIVPHLKVFVVGGAPFSPDLAYFYMALGFNIIEGYGLTETTAPISVNPSWANKIGTVGLPFTHFSCQIADDGEIIVKGPCVFKEYFKNPEATAEALKDGWFYTGDLGKFDDEGYLQITGRKKDILITAAGKNIAPQKIEQLMQRSKYINQIVVLGDREKYLAALIVCDKHEIERYLQSQKISLKENQKYSDSPEINKLIDSEINEYSGELASYERIKAFYLLDDELTIENGELTPTLKIRRNRIRERYRDLIQPLFMRSKPRED